MIESSTLETLECYNFVIIWHSKFYSYQFFLLVVELVSVLLVLVWIIRYTFCCCYFILVFQEGNHILSIDFMELKCGMQAICIMQHCTYLSFLHLSSCTFFFWETDTLSGKKLVQKAPHNICNLSCTNNKYVHTHFHHLATVCMWLIWGSLIILWLVSSVLWEYLEWLSLQQLPQWSLQFNQVMLFVWMWII